MAKRDEFVAEINRLQAARQRTTSKHLRTDYSKAIKRKRKELMLYDFNHRRKTT